MSLNASDVATRPPTPVRGQCSGSRTLGTSPRTSVSPLASVRRWEIRADACPPSRPRGIFPPQIQTVVCPPAVSVELAAVAPALAGGPAGGGPGAGPGRGGGGGPAGGGGGGKGAKDPADVRPPRAHGGHWKEAP